MNEKKNFDKQIPSIEDVLIKKIGGEKAEE